MNPCNACPRQCNVDRSKELGWCKMDDRIHVSSIVLHRGEEPPISGEDGIVNVFFPSCNMQCIYCQNWQISCRGNQGKVMTLDEVCDSIIKLLPLSENNLGFVSPTHFVSQMVMIVKELRRCGHNPTIIYNSNGYDLPKTLRKLESIVDVWLPDFKYSDDVLAEELSQAPGYSKYALTSVKEMVHQVGTTLLTDNYGIARRGIIIRHLVLPGLVENSTGILKIIAEELSPSLHLSIMSQYYPPHKLIRNSSTEEGILRWQEPGGVLSTSTLNPEPEHSGVRPSQAWKSLKRTVTCSEYESVLEAFHCFGFTRGWLQDYNSQFSYRPDFSRKTPFNLE